MKLKTIKAHYHDNTYMNPGSVYMSDKVHGKRVVERGICKEMAKRKR